MNVSKYILIVLTLSLFSCDENNTSRVDNSSEIVADFTNDKLGRFNSYLNKKKVGLKDLSPKSPYINMSSIERDFLDNQDSIISKIQNHCKDLIDQLNNIKKSQNYTQLKKSIHKLRNHLGVLIGNHQGDKEGETFEWTSNKLKSLQSNSGKDKLAFHNTILNSLVNVDPKDTTLISIICQSLTIPVVVDIGHQKIDWSDTFTKSPNPTQQSLQLDILKSEISRIENICLKHIHDKINWMNFEFYKIEFIAFGNKQTINTSDHLRLTIVPSRCDSTLREIRCYQNDSTHYLSENNGYSFKIQPANIGKNEIKGEVKVKEYGTEVWKPFKYDYYVKE
ncbi:MAG: hypothetical protein ACI9N1_002559 [Flavobacteriales bacterium]|jgi:hypothetical protein